ncbi:MAG: DUF5696 domain-containing protein [Oscillospiraceae bacterium]|nr:DUF5696 domain-containing protein [Oscillospiraceae bacterium]
MKRINFLRRIAPAFILLAVIISFCACGKEIKSGRFELTGSPLTSEKKTAYAQARKFGAAQKITTSSMLELYFNESTGDVAVRNANTGKWWYSLPEKYVASGSFTPSVVSAQVICGGQIYELNSCVDANDYVKVTSEKIANGIRAKYTLKYKIDDQQTIKYVIPVEYTLVDGNFCAKIDCGGIENAGTVSDAVITKIRLLDFFGSSTAASANEYLLVPDNCGGIIRTAKATENFKDISLKIFGDAEVNNAIFGVFGVKIENDAFVCIIRQGDAVATVNAGTAKSESKYNKVGAQFDITESKTFQRKDKTYISVAGETYNGELELCYRFLSGDNANYSGMSVACREQLIRDGVLLSNVTDADGDLPMVLSVLATANTQPSKLSVLTTFEQLQDMLTHLKSKGFSNIYVRYKGAFSGSDSQSSITDIEFLKSLGTDENFNELKDYMSAQNLTLFADFKCFTDPKGGKLASKFAQNVSNEVEIMTEENGFSVKSERSVTGLYSIAANVISLIRFAKDNGLDAVSVSDASFLYSDYSKGATRDDVKKELAEEISSVSGTSRLMVQKGNFYTLKNAEVISDMPLNTSISNSACYESVPFAQLVLHGTLDYSCEPINLEMDYRKAILRAVEYGALPSFEWCYEDIQTEEPESGKNAKETESTTAKVAETAAEKEGIDKKYSYTQWANVAYSYYEKANKALGDIRDRRMTSHYKVSDGVYCTEYDDTRIYVNYTSKNVVIRGVTVPANDFMRIN